MKKIAVTVLMVAGLAGCAGVTDRLGLGDRFKRSSDPAAPLDALAPASELPAETTAPPPPVAAKTAAALDTTTPEQRAAAAVKAPEATSKALGKTVVSLGSPTEPGLWLKTPLVKTETQGRVTNPANGKSSAVTLIPIDGPATAGSRMSLAALRLIEASLTDLTEVDVALES